MSCSGCGLPDAWIVSGCLVQTAWNTLTGRAVGHGIDDYDVFYFDSDTSWQAEDAAIRQLRGRFARLGVKVELRNQARVHLWYPHKHGLPYPALQSSIQGIDRFLTRTTQVGIRRSRDGHDVYAPHGFDDIAGMIVRPNLSPNFSAANYRSQGARAGNGSGRNSRCLPLTPLIRDSLPVHARSTAPRRR